ncbi:MAG: M23 family metallopeptidase [Corynebacterium sp.]|nr:M23 family metallopeptidase [Corynebacterium sp.]
MRKGLTVGKHARNTTAATVKRGARGGIAIAALAVSATGTASAAGALAANVDGNFTANITDSTHAISLVNASASETSTDAPIIASVASTQNLDSADADAPITFSFDSEADSLNADVIGQLGASTDFNAQRMHEDELARLPLTVRPAEGTLSSTYGSRWGTVHHGIDIANALGTPIVSATDGTVIDAGPASGYGNWVRVRTDDGYILVYGHMEAILTSVGARVSAGDLIALMGSQGQSTGSHLHFAVYDQQEQAIDPLPWLAERGVIIS